MSFQYDNMSELYDFTKSDNFVANKIATHISEKTFYGEGYKGRKKGCTTCEYDIFMIARKELIQNGHWVNYRFENDTLIVDVARY